MKVLLLQIPRTSGKRREYAWSIKIYLQTDQMRLNNHVTLHNPVHMSSKSLSYSERAPLGGTIPYHGERPLNDIGKGAQVKERMPNRYCTTYVRTSVDFVENHHFTSGNPTFIFKTLRFKTPGLGN